jgi:hypothetical protein
VESDNGEPRNRTDAVETGGPAHMPDLIAGINRYRCFPRRFVKLPGLVIRHAHTFLC